MANSLRNVAAQEAYHALERHFVAVGDAFDASAVIFRSTLVRRKRIFFAVLLVTVV